VPDRATRIDGRGRFLIAGLADMHAHVTARDLPLFLANGITTVREMNGSPAHLAWRDSVRSELMAGPNVVVTTPLLAGEPQRYRHRLIATPDAATEAVEEAQRLGYDAIKVYDGLSIDAYSALAAAAARAGLSLTGHVPAALGLQGVVQRGQRSIEHVEQIVRQLDGHPADSAAIAAAVDGLAGTGVWVTPTLAVIERLSLSRSAGVQALFRRPEMAYVDSATMAWWKAFERPGNGEAAAGAVRQAEAYRAVARRMLARGIPLLVGTDTPNPFMVPGFSLLDELIALEAIGYTRSALLAAATVGAARFLGLEEESGRVAAGFRADLVLTAKDPLANWNNLRDPELVVVGGRSYAREELGRLLRSVALAR
jgi:imidazolonepropionase-like amidohydrolase